MLPLRINLQERVALADAVARLHQDLGDLSFDLRMNGRRPQRLEDPHVLGRLFERAKTRGFELHAVGGNARPLGGPDASRPHPDVAADTITTAAATALWQRMARMTLLERDWIRWPERSG